MKIKNKISDWFKNRQEKIHASNYSAKTKRSIEKILNGTKNEAVETKEMADTFFKVLSANLNLDERSNPPTEKKVKAAIEQLKDIGRISVFASVSILPGGGFSLIGLELLARKFGIKNFTLVPSSFRKKEISLKKKQDIVSAKKDTSIYIKLRNK